MITNSKKEEIVDITQAKKVNYSVSKLLGKTNPPQEELMSETPSVVENMRLRLSNIMGLIEQAKSQIDETRTNFESSVVSTTQSSDDTENKSINIIDSGGSPPDYHPKPGSDKMFSEFITSDSDDDELEELLSNLDISDSVKNARRSVFTVTKNKVKEPSTFDNMMDNKLVIGHDTEFQTRIDRIVEESVLLLQDVMKGDLVRLVEMMQRRMYDLKTSDYTTPGLNSIGLKIILGCTLNSCIDLSGLVYEYYSQRSTPLADDISHYPRLGSGNNLVVFNLLMLSYSYMSDGTSYLGIKKYSGRVSDRDIAENNVAILKNASIVSIKKLGYEYTENHVHPLGKYDPDDLPKNTVKQPAIPVGTIIEAYQKRCSYIQNTLRKVLSDDLDIRCVLICCVGSRILSFDAK